MAYRATVFGAWFDSIKGEQTCRILSEGFGETAEEAQANVDSNIPAGVQRHKLVTCKATEPQLDPWDVFNQPIRVALDHARAKREMEA